MKQKIYFKNNTFYFEKVDNAIELSIEEYNELVKKTLNHKIIKEENGKLILVNIDIQKIKENKIKELNFTITDYIYSKYKITKQINIQREYFLNPNDETKKEEFIQMNLFINTIRDNFHKIENEINNIQEIEELEKINMQDLNIEEIEGV